MSSLGVAATNFKSINFRELAKIILLMLSGIGCSYLVRDYIMGSQRLLYILLGSLTIAVSVFNFAKLISGKETKPLPSWAGWILLFASGVVHGVFVCGGPILVIYASQKLTDSKQFRSTLSAVWVVLNSIIFAMDIRDGAFTSQTVTMTLVSVAVLAAALFIGNFAAKKLSKKAFLVITYVLMLISGASLIFNA